jgi:hypothetical protein
MVELMIKCPSKTMAIFFTTFSEGNVTASAFDCGKETSARIHHREWLRIVTV